MHQAISIHRNRITALLSDGTRLGRIRNVAYIDLSWVVVFAFVAYLNSSSFDQLHPHWAPNRSWSVAALTSLMFFICVLLHELAHRVVAQFYDVPVSTGPVQWCWTAAP